MNIFLEKKDICLFLCFISKHILETMTISLKQAKINPTVWVLAHPCFITLTAWTAHHCSGEQWQSGNCSRQQGNLWDALQISLSAVTDVQRVSGSPNVPSTKNLIYIPEMPSKGLDHNDLSHRHNNINENSETGHILRGYTEEEERTAMWEN